MELPRHTLLAALVVSALAFALNEWTAAPPPVKPATAPASDFSAQRAFSVLSTLLADGVPHPVASDANRRVRARIEDYLEEHGIAFEVQSALGCATRFNRCAFVENIVATIPGERPGPYVALMAHYDSVPMAPGAGDDGAGLVTVLETGRILSAEGPRRNPLMLILTDGEEAGLLGAEAFFKQHPLADDVGVVVNIEGAGTTGASMVLRTAGATSALVELYEGVADYPFANSLADEIFKRMPNDTDFSVSLRAGVPGVDFAFAGEFTHYHTPNDNLENLDLRTLQHHGENMLPLARVLLDTDLETLKSSAPSVHLQVLGLWIGWPAWVNWVLIVISAALLTTVAWRTHVRDRSGWKQWVLGAFAPVLIVAGAVSTGWVAFKSLEIIRGTIVSWPAVLWPWRLVLFGAPALGGLVVAGVVNRWLTLSLSLVVAFSAWLLMAIALAIVVPAATGILLAPLVFALALFAIATVVRNQVLRLLLISLAFIAAVTQTLGIVMPLEQSQGYRLGLAMFPFVALFMVLLSPLVRGRTAAVSSAAAAVVGTGMVAAALSPLYSEWRPQHVNVYYVENLDAAEAWWSLDSPNPLPEKLLATKDFSLENVAPYSWSDALTVDVAARAPRSGWQGPRVETIADSVADGTRTLSLELTPTRAADYLMLVLPMEAGPERFRIEGVDVEPARIESPLFKDRYVLQVMGMGDRPVHVTLELASTQPFEAFVADVSTRLPEGAKPILEARPPLATPVHSADTAVVYRKVAL